MKMIKKSLAMVSVFALALATTAITAEDALENENAEIVEPRIVDGVPADVVAKEQEIEAAIAAGIPLSGYACSQFRPRFASWSIAVNALISTHDIIVWA